MAFDDGLCYVWVSFRTAASFLSNHYPHRFFAVNIGVATVSYFLPTVIFAFTLDHS